MHGDTKDLLPAAPSGMYLRAVWRGSRAENPGSYTS